MYLFIAVLLGSTESGVRPLAANRVGFRTVTVPPCVFTYKTKAEWCGRMDITEGKNSSYTVRLMKTLINTSHFKVNKLYQLCCDYFNDHCLTANFATKMQQLTGLVTASDLPNWLSAQKLISAIWYKDWCTWLRKATLNLRSGRRGTPAIFWRPKLFRKLL
jgi:hypothetical protein